MALTVKKVYAILKRQISDMEAKLNSPVRYRGTVATADLLPLNPDIGDMYNIESKSVYGEAGMNVAWNGVVWDTMGAPIDMSLYFTKEEAEGVIQRLVTEYFEKNPVKPGATTEQAQQIEQNKTDIASLKTETSSLKEDLSNKITKFYASSHGETHITDSDNGKIQDMMLYGKSSQDGTPSLENPVEIKSVVNPVIKICGKNLFDSKKFPIILNRAIDTNTGKIYESLSGNYCATEKYIPFPYSGKKVSFNASMTLCAYDKDYKFINTVNRNKGQVPTGTMYVRFDIKIEEKDKAQIELSENATTYEPYKEQTIQLTIILNAISVSSGGNVTINGQQYIADYVDVERGKLVRLNGFKKITSNDVVSINDSKVLYAKTYDVWDSINYVQRSLTAMSNISEAMLDTVNNSGWNGESRIRIKNVPFANIDEAKSYFGTNDVYCCYPLATPTEIDLAPEEIQALKALATYYPTTNIFINSEQLDGYTVFNYPISMANGWNYVKQQIGDTRDYIYDMDAKAQDIDTQAAEAYVNSEYAVALTELEV